jgi:outer membrane protein assembly factor BamB
LFLILTFAVSLVAMPAANAHTPSWNIPTFAHIFAATDPVGVGQSAKIYLFLTPTYPNENMENDYRFHNYKLVITDPNGKQQTMKWDTCWDTTSNQFASFTPTEVGTYTLEFSFPGQYVNDYSHAPDSDYIDDYFLPSNASTTLTVIDHDVSYLPISPLPTEYWSRPIFGENTAWWSISSNWLGSGMPGYGGSTGPNQRQFPGDAVGSLTSHIVWTKAVQPGGVVGGNLPEIQGNTWFEGTAYSQRYVNPIIVAGRLYYQEPLGWNGSPGFFGGDAGPVVCVDLATGQEVWRRADVPPISFAYVQDCETPNFHGVRPAMLVAAVGGGFFGGPQSWQVYDAATGDALFNVSNVPGPRGSYATVIGPQGEQIRYILNNNGTRQNPDWYLCQWNSSRIWNQASMSEGNPMIPYGETSVPASSSFMYDTLDASTQNKSLTWLNTMPNTPSILGAIYGDIMLCMNGSYPGLGEGRQNPYTYFAVNLNASKGTVGQVLWWNNVNPPAGNITTISFAGMDPSGYFCESYRQTEQFVFWNLRTGAYIKTADPQPALDYYGSNGPGTLSNVVAFGRCYSSAYSGVLYCYDMSTGDVLWTYGNGHVPGNDTYSGYQVPGPYPTFINAIGGHTVDDGVIYTVTTEHTFETPIYKGALVRAINASDGTELWTLPAATGEFLGESYAIADGYSNFFNSYDQQIYTLGRGPSAMTVQVGPKSSTLGGNVVIEGTVTDISVGTNQNEQATRFPQGVPVCADSSMTEWMEYVYQQQPKPANFTGVNVDIVLLDSNHNYRNIGTVTTDDKGQFSLTWTPDIPGDFKVFATFAGTNGYWPSNAETNFNIVDKQPTPTPAETPPPSMADLYFMPMTVGMIIAIAVVIALLALLLLRKRP